MASVVLDGSVAADQLYASSVRVGGSGIDCRGGGQFHSKVVLLGEPRHYTAPVPSDNALTLDGCRLSLHAAEITAPQTAAAHVNMTLNGSITSPELEMRLLSSSPALAADGSILVSYATTADVAANSLVVARSVSSRPSPEPAGSYNDARTQVAAADLIACPTITVQSRVRTWLAGVTGVVGATAVLPATATLFVPGTGFTLNGTIGAIYGYQVLYG